MTILTTISTFWMKTGKNQPKQQGNKAQGITGSENFEKNVRQFETDESTASKVIENKEQLRTNPATGFSINMVERINLATADGPVNRRTNAHAVQRNVQTLVDKIKEEQNQQDKPTSYYRN